MTLEWLGDDGPLVLLAEAHSTGWDGIWRDATAGDPEDEIEELGGRRVLMDVTLDGERTDYARACALLSAPAAAAVVPYRAGVALALETSGHEVALLPWPGGVIVAKRIYAPSPAHAQTVLARASELEAWAETGVEWEAPPGGVRLHPAASRYEEGGIAFALAPGRYTVLTALYEPDEDSSFELFALRAR